MTVTTEYFPLRGVIIHSPGAEWDMIPVGPGMAEKYLVEDILYLPAAQEDHREFADCLRHVTGSSATHELQTLLAESLTDKATRTELVAEVCALEGLGQAGRGFLSSNELTTAELSEILLSGSRRIPTATGRPTIQTFFGPIPNFMFTRDIGMFVNNAIVMAQPAKAVRRREGILARFVFQKHPLFNGREIIDIADLLPAPGSIEQLTLEGGDLMVLDKDTIVIGSSQRTTQRAIDALMSELFSRGIITRVIVVTLPSDRATMHLDTVFTVIGPDECVYYPLFFDEGGPNALPCPATIFEYAGGITKVVHRSIPKGLFSALERIGYHFSERIPCGGDNTFMQTREQWTDGANLFAVRPRVAFLYERNIITLDEFRRRGYRILSPKEFLATDPQTVDRVIVTISGSELSRGRGGARCLTMPIDRA